MEGVNSATSSHFPEWRSDRQPPLAPSDSNTASPPYPREMRGADAEGRGGPATNNLGNADAQSDGNNRDWVPRPKRIACVVCRKRKLRCDGKKPSCGTCARLSHDCAYDEMRKKSGPKRGYVKQLEARLAQVETLLKSQDPSDATAKPAAPAEMPFRPPVQSISAGTLPNGPAMPKDTMDTGMSLPHQDFVDLVGQMPDLIENPSPSFSWEMIGLGLEEPLPSQDVIDELNEIYFQKVHPSLPMIHRPRYYAAMNLAPNMRPPIGLRYMMWGLAALATNKYMALHSHFYQRARKYMELDEMKGLGEAMITVAHCQAWCLIASYEFKLMHFPRAWMSTGKSSRLALMMGLHRQDGAGLDVKQCLPPARDWTEREERRRTFWAAFCQDRYASTGTGWPMMLDERDILTNLPANDEAFVNCKQQQTPTLADMLARENASQLSSFGSIALLACLFGRNLQHLHRATVNDREYDLNGEFWKRHRALDNILLNTSLSLPSHLRLPEGINEPNVIFGNMCIHTSTICLHQAAIYKAEKYKLPNQISVESKRRCIIAADQITNIMKMISHIDLGTMNPFLAFCLYVAARVLVQYLKSRPEDGTVRSSLQFLLSAMNILKQRNPLTESFLAQLEIDLQSSGLDNDGELVKHPKVSNVEGIEDAGCIPILNFSKDDPKEQSGNAKRRCPLGIDVTPQQPADSTFEAVPGQHASFQGTTSSLEQYLVPHLAQDQVQSLVMELDMSTEVSTGSDRMHSYSDHTTPSTNKASSNSSFSPPHADQPSPKQFQQQQQPTLYPPTTTTTTSSQLNNLPPTTSTSSPPGYTAFFTGSADFREEQSGFENPFSFSSGWDVPLRQPQQETTPSTSSASASASAQMPSVTGAAPPFGDMTWPQTPNVTGWNNWQS
ncbi:hypothetical protein AJ80_00882 [Polytolypa hystricis UAMH7299]|uniref:Zn(2)-C6 fungal-type domain-containing protein n=1 Tax=Polytolypa hystricis (strain UAMH7299) TaxID=1447883 RepID=A0A2B7YTN4_POLH7|nr:hypothetical protein AJ80_00882 [Polytolypa hystricis UAMH7299]